MPDTCKKIGILLIATNKYKQFVNPLITALDKYFLPNHQLSVFLFTDEMHYKFNASERISILITQIPPYKFPFATLYRYKIFADNSNLFNLCDYLFYMDVDMDIVAPVGDEILAPLTAVRHPGFYNGGGSWGNDPKSTAYTKPENRKHYYAGGFQGGSKNYYLSVVCLLADRIAADEENEIMAQWHDETHWNWYLANNPVFKELSPEYCMVEQQHLRQDWGIDHLEPKIIALAKDHAELRS